jgi:hypothetical protein
MPKRCERPRKDKKSGFYYFDEYLGFGQDKKRIRFSLKTKGPDKARFRWEQEYRKYWSKYYGVESPAITSIISFPALADEFIEYERTIKKVREWETMKNWLRIIYELWGDVNLDEIDRDRFVKLDLYLKKKGRSRLRSIIILGYLNLYSTMISR